jgi:acyl-CoA synthetase (NDP forming)
VIYVEGIENCRAFYEELKNLTEVKSFAIMKAGRSKVADFRACFDSMMSYARTRKGGST